MRFLATRELGRLTRWLRLLGFDTAYAKQEESPVDLFIRSVWEGRVLLTRQRVLTRRHGIRYLWVKSDQVREQLKQILREAGSPPEKEALFSRCLNCNTLLKRVEKDLVSTRVPPFVLKTVEDFVLCPTCDQIFWPGTHLNLAEAFLKSLGSGEPFRK